MPALPNVWPSREQFNRKGDCLMQHPSEYSDMLKQLSYRDVKFLDEYCRYMADATNPRDADLAKRLGVTRDTILHRRRRIREAGFNLPPLAPRGFRKPGDMSVPASNWRPEPEYYI